MKAWALIIPSLWLLSSQARAVDFEDYATVRSVTPQIERVNYPREECQSEYPPARAGGERGVSGSIIGGIAGALLGNQVGQGNGRTAATAVGAVTGAIVGDRVQNNDGSRGDGRELRRCHTVDHWEERNDGYRVVYEYAGHRASTVLPYDPGNTMKVRVSIAPN
ncbi:MAG: glycine zipper 2TM domain-containing protein [Burkholderiales bacterium]